MQQSILYELLFILVLILLNGLFSMSELAIVSARKNRLIEQAERGDHGAKTALGLSDNPNRFLSTVQIGITLIGILSGALGGATLAEEIAKSLSNIPWLKPYSEAIGVGIVVLFITYFSLVLGELVPKRLALNNAEKIAMTVAPLMRGISKITTPVVSLLSWSTEMVLRILRIRPPEGPPVTEEDVRSMINQGTRFGVFEVSEEEMVSQVFRLGDRRVSTVMTPRTQMSFLDIDEPLPDQLADVIASGYSNYPVIQDSSDNVIGIVNIKDLFRLAATGQPLEIRSVLMQVLFLPESMTVLEALQEMRKSGIKMAMVIDEYSGICGVISLQDIVEAIIGDIDLPKANEEPEVVIREDGSLLLDGLLPADELLEIMELDSLPEEGKGYYETLGGLMMYLLGKIPSVGETCEWSGYRLEVLDMDGRRVDKVLASRVKDPDTAAI